MPSQEPIPQPETLLDQWLRETDSRRAAELLNSLVSLYAQPLIRRIVTFKLASAGSGVQRADVDDVCNTAVYNLLARLERLRTGETQSTVRTFSGYVAVIAYNACNEYFRAKKPAWLSLAMKLRYLMTYSPKMGLWETSDGQEACGFTQTRGRQPITNPAALSDARDALRRSRDPSSLSQYGATNPDSQCRGLRCESRKPRRRAAYERSWSHV